MNRYWTSIGEVAVMATRLAGGSATQLYSFGFSVPQGVAIGPQGSALLTSRHAGPSAEILVGGAAADRPVSVRGFRRS
jgi:hypothetical protein